jgi:NADH-quinone oxidoreductase subunit N
MPLIDDLVTLLPELVLTLLVLVVITVDLFLSRGSKWLLTPLTVAGLLLAGAACFVVWETPDPVVYNGFYVVDNLSVFIKGATIVTGILSALFAPSYLIARRIPLGEFYTILISALIGMCVLASSADLITLFLGLELMTMPSYLLTGLHKTDRYSNEGGLKYFLLGSFASAILLFGTAWTYGLTGTTSIAGIAAAVGGEMSAGMLVAIGFLTVGATFKIAAVPFHYWTPDAYQGAPTPITGFLSVGPKIGAFALLIRIFAEALAPLRADWLGIFLVLTVLTMTVGNIVALTQTNVKRMLAYSSIAHTGYIMAGIAAYANAPDAETAALGIQSVLFYLFGYAVMNIAAFAVVGMLQRDPSRFGGLNSFAGLASRAPWHAAAMTVLLLSLTGIPPTIGFFAKYFVLIATVESGLVWLAVIIVLNAALAAFYYLRVVVYMFMREPVADAATAPTHGRLLWSGLAVATVLTILFGVFPDIILGIVTEAATAIGT